MYSQGHIDSPGYKTFQHLVMLADKLYKAWGGHSEQANRGRGRRRRKCLKLKLNMMLDHDRGHVAKDTAQGSTQFWIKCTSHEI